MYLDNIEHIRFSLAIYLHGFFSFYFRSNSALRSVDVTAETKQFHEILLERTKALAAQTEALKSSHSDGKSIKS